MQTHTQVLEREPIILGISAFFHDSAAALLRGGEVVAAAQEERFSRQKHDAGLPLEAVRFCLEQAGIGIEDVDDVIFYEKPLRKFERLLLTQLRSFPRGLSQFCRAMGTWLGRRLWLKGQIAKQLGCDPDRIAFSEHHLSHAASAFYPSPFESAAVLTADGVGEWTTAGIYRAVGPTADAPGRVELVKELTFPHSIGLLYSALTAYLGFRVNNGEYKVMGLAAYGEPRFREAFAHFVTIEDDGALELDMRYFAYHRHPSKSFTSKLEALLGPARVPGSPLDPTAAGDAESRRFADVAATLQVLTEEWLLKAAAEAQRLTGERHLCLAGGVALNSVANGRLAEEGPFDQIFVQPAAGDAGGALGAALHLAHGVYGVERRERLEHCFFGRGYAHEQVESLLGTWRVRHRVLSEEALNREVAQRLAEGEVGGWFKGRFEWGPRALGNRSILADPRRAEMTERVNAKIKFRESFRPFAPAVLADAAPRYFEVGRSDLLAPWMLSVVPVTDTGRESLPAVTHANGTARVQTVSDTSSPALAGLLREFQAQTGVGVLLNTSMNLKGEPICATPAEAVSVFERSGLDFLVIERCLLTKAA